MKWTTDQRNTWAAQCFSFVSPILIGQCNLKSGCQNNRNRNKSKCIPIFKEFSEPSRNLKLTEVGLLIDSEIFHVKRTMYIIHFKCISKTTKLYSNKQTKKKTNEPTKKKKETKIQETLCYSEAVMAWGGKICAMAIVSRWNRYQCQELALMLDIPTTAYIAHARIMYFRYHTSLGEREIEINQIKTIWNVSDEYITKTSSWRTIIISFINVIVRNYNFLFSLRWYKWMKKRHKNENEKQQQQQQNTKKKRNKSMNARSVIENTEGMVEHSTYVAFYIENG